MIFGEARFFDPEKALEISSFQKSNQTDLTTLQVRLNNKYFKPMTSFDASAPKAEREFGFKTRALHAGSSPDIKPGNSREFNLDFTFSGEV